MLVIYVIAGVIGLIIYKLVKINIEELFEKPRMDRLSLKRKSAANGKSHAENASPTSLSDVIEITDDESNVSSTHEISNDSDVVPAKSKHYDEETLHNFQKSTDSIESDEDIEQKPQRSKPMTSLFGWNSRKSNRNRNNSSDSNSSDDASTSTKWFKYKQEKKSKIYESTEALNEKESNKNSPPEVIIQHEQMISGIKVKLPVKPYSSQIAVMNKLIQGCVKKENCLLESPTGSGKTLALLCSVLAWHDQHCAVVEKSRDAEVGGGDYGNDTFCDDNTAGPFKNLNKTCGDKSYSDDEKPSKKMPKIYYGTRTHKQIEQVIRELNKTSYRHKKMTILSSREHTCIQNTTRNKTELCNELLDSRKHKGCPYYNEGNKKAITNFRAAESYGLGPVWDIEDLVEIGRGNDICPYFAARNLMDHADIIFCPYNYIIDPDIRESMQLNLKNQVIILDEAHNMEDICREAASVDFREDDLNASAVECDSLVKQSVSDSYTYTSIKVYLLKLMAFIKTMQLDKVDYISEDLSSQYWTGEDLLELFNMNKLGESSYADFYAASSAALLDYDKAKEGKNLKAVISTSTKLILEHLRFGMRMITSKEFMNDYRACVIETTVKDFKYIEENTWHSVKKQTQRARTLKLLCMNPGVIFAPLAESARCIILTSGTLTPTASFQSELNTKFAHVLNTAHVIPKEQVYATFVPKGPNGVFLKANYQNVNSWGFQDELGQVLLDVCSSVPHGILCFFSSYNVMHTQTERWKKNNTWSKIARTKQVFIEPRFGGDLNQLMTEYREVIEETSEERRGNINGALFLAVFRGKVAEGIDFKDNEARCVVTVGIPYGVRKDPVIDMKFKYNDMNTAKGLLRGSEWYTIQAFRALNQALGRCLRHIDDWGAVLLVDERFLIPYNQGYLPKWVKTMWVKRNDYSLKDDLTTFVANQKARERKKQSSVV